MTSDREAFEAVFGADPKEATVNEIMLNRATYLGWQSARAESAKEIAALKSQIEFLDEQLKVSDETRGASCRKMR